jgi:hypothetical protein
MHTRFLALLCMMALPSLAPASEKAPRVVLTIHTEMSANDSEKFVRPIELLHAKRTAYISVGPELSDRDVYDVIPFDAKDGTSKGAYLRLSPGGRIRLEGISQANRGKALVVFAQGRQVVDLYIDRRIEDGILPIPSGLTDIEIAELKKRAEKNRKSE